MKECWQPKASTSFNLESLFTLPSSWRLSTQCRSMGEPVFPLFFKILFIYLLIAFQGHTCSLWRFPGQGLNWSCGHWPTPQPQPHQIWAVSATYTSAHGKPTEWGQGSNLRPHGCWSDSFLLSHKGNSSTWLLTTRRQDCESRLASRTEWESDSSYHWLHNHSFPTISSFSAYFSISQNVFHRILIVEIRPEKWFPEFKIFGEFSLSFLLIYYQKLLKNPILINKPLSWFNLLFPKHLLLEHSLIVIINWGWQS